MLKVFGHIYSSNSEDFDVIKNSLEAEGYEIAYEGAYNAAVIKEIPDEEISE